MFHKCSDKCLCAISQPGGKETVLYCYGEVSGQWSVGERPVQIYQGLGWIFYPINSPSSYFAQFERENHLIVSIKRWNFHLNSGSDSQRQRLWSDTLTESDRNMSPDYCTTPVLISVVLRDATNRQILLTLIFRTLSSRLWRRRYISAVGGLSF